MKKITQEQWVLIGAAIFALWYLQRERTSAAAAAQAQPNAPVPGSNPSVPMGGPGSL